MLKAVSDLGFEKPSEIQAKAIPQLIDGQRDFIGLAQTGTGKTAAFGLPLLQRIDPFDTATQALVLAPTRELGQQIAEQINVFSKYLKQVNVLAVYGGASIAAQIKALRKPQHVIIATPGRLIDLIQRKAVKLDQLRCLVLDEADEMLNMGFKQDLDRILSYTPEDKRVWLLSATMSSDIQRIVKKYMADPFEVKLNTRNEVNGNIEHQFAVVKQSDKVEALTRFLDIEPELRGVVFCRTKRDTQRLADILSRKDYLADSLHGDLNQRQRDRVMRQFKAHELQLLVATDIAARGIDVNDLTHVFHFTLPDDLAYYTHRSGRTARAGKKGTSIAFINGREKSKIDVLKKKLDISFERVQIPNGTDIHDVRVQNWCVEILEKKTNGRLNPELLEKASLLFGNLSKEELIAKILMNELEKTNAGDATRDLNEKLTHHQSDKNPNYNGSGRKHYGKNGAKSRKKQYRKRRT